MFSKNLTRLIISICNWLRRIQHSIDMHLRLIILRLLWCLDVIFAVLTQTQTFLHSYPNWLKCWKRHQLHVTKRLRCNRENHGITVWARGPYVRGPTGKYLVVRWLWHKKIYANTTWKNNIKNRTPGNPLNCLNLSNGIGITQSAHRCRQFH